MQRNFGNFRNFSNIGGEGETEKKRRCKKLEKRIVALEAQVQRQQIVGQILWEFCGSVANKEKMDLLSYQQFYSPSTDSAENIRILIEEIFKSGKHATN